MNFIKNWKTSLAGVAGIFSVVTKVINNDFNFGMEDIAMVTASLGLIFAKDKNVTGGTVAQATPASVEYEKQDLAKQ